MSFPILDPSTTLATLDAAGVRFFSGVPDSLLKDFCAQVTDHVAAERHVIAANEGAAVALAAGFHLATGDLGLVYLQNSGLGNAVNPILSLADVAVYGIPMLLLIGWRGDPGALPACLSQVLAVEGPALLEGRIRPGARLDLGRPTSTPADNKRAFVARLRRP